MEALTAIVLCGGRSSRMGRDKGLLSVGGETMLARVCRLLTGITGEVMVVGRRDQAQTTVQDAVEDQGPLAGIAAGLAASQTDLNIIVACDMPLIRPAVLERLTSMIGDHDACVPIANGHASPLCGVYRKHVAIDAETLLKSGEHRVMRLLDRINTKRVDAEVFRDLDAGLETFLSVDTPEKYAEVQLQLKLLP